MMLSFTVKIVQSFIEEFRNKFILETFEDFLFMLLLINEKDYRTFSAAIALSSAIFMGMIYRNFFVSFLTFCLVLLGLIGGLYNYRKKRILKFETQLTDALNMLANGLRAGLTLQQSMEQVTKEYDNPLRQEFKLFLREIKLGKQFEEAMEDMSGRVGSEDLTLLVTSINISRQLGGNIAEAFDTISTTIRERFRLEGKIRAMTSQGKMQGLIVSALPSIMGFIFYLMREDLMGPFLSSWQGWILLSGILLMQIAGFLVIRKIVNVEV